MHWHLLTLRTTIEASMDLPLSYLDQNKRRYLHAPKSRSIRSHSFRAVQTHGGVVLELDMFSVSCSTNSQDPSYKSNYSRRLHGVISGDENGG